MRGQRLDELARVIRTDRMEVDRNPELVEPRAKARVLLDQCLHLGRIDGAK